MIRSIYKDPAVCMMLVVLLYIFTVGTCTSCLSSVQRPRSVDQPARAVKVTAICSEKDTLNASGVVTGPYTVLTANHVVAHCDSPTVLVTSWDGTLRFASVSTRYKTLDIASLGILGTTGFAPAPVTLIKDTKVCVLTGYPERHKICSEVTRGDLVEFYFSGETVPGNSGSGVWDVEGNLVGIVTKWRQCADGTNCGGAASTTWLVQ